MIRKLEMIYELTPETHNLTQSFAEYAQELPTNHY